jgi:peptide/nickel transport system ATP-binding protein/oligopeptide transport system ATP-binding protein
MASAPRTILAFRDLCISYGRSTVVRDMSLDLCRGEVAAIVGESGSGKTQSMLAALRLLPPAAVTTGSVSFEDADLLTLAQAPLDAIRGRRIAIVFQEPMSALDPLFPVGAQICAVLRLKAGLAAREAQSRAVDLLTLVGLDEPRRRLRAYPHEMSGGQRQRIAIAMAIACGPDVLVADEPTTALDVTVALRILDLLADLKQRLGMAMILVSHDLALVRRYADRIHVMRDGEIVESGGARALVAAPRHPYTRRLLESVPPPRHGRETATAPTLLAAEALEVRFSLRGGLFQKGHEIRAVDRVGLVLRRGISLGVVGESGSGKSTLARALLKLVPARGSLWFDGHDLTRLDRAAMRPFRRSMQLVFQDPFGSLSPRLRIGEIISEGLLVHEPGLSRAARDARAAAALEEVSLDPALRHRFPNELSGGQRQRVAIARAMILKPQLVVLDEPTSALDRTVQIEILGLLTRLQEAHGLTYVFISHDLAVIRAIADEILVMQSGRVVEYGAAEQILSAPKEAYTRALIAAAFPA